MLAEQLELPVALEPTGFDLQNVVEHLVKRLLPPNVTLFCSHIVVFDKYHQILVQRSENPDRFSSFDDMCPT